MSRKLPGVTPKSKADGKAGSPNNKNNTGDIDGSSSSEIKQNYLDLAYSSDASRDDEEAGSLEPSPGNSSGRSAPKGGESPKAGMNGIGHRVIENGIKRKVESSASQNGNGIHEHAALPSASPSKANGTPNKRRKLHDTPSKEKRKSEWAARKNVLQREQQLVRKSADNLPVNEAKDALVMAVLENDTVVIMAETGSGKSTQIPQILTTHPKSLEYFESLRSPEAGPSSPRASNGSSKADPKPGRLTPPTIAITQPRRLPCVSLATRVAQEMAVELGEEVGYAVRFESKENFGRRGGAAGKRRGETTVRFCTEGVLLRELSDNPSAIHSRTARAFKQGAHLQPADSLENSPTTSNFSPESSLDSPTPSSSKTPIKLEVDSAETHKRNEASRLLLRYDVVIVDEAHERTLNTDFLLGTLKAVQQERSDLVERLKKQQQHAANRDAEKIGEDKNDQEDANVLGDYGGYPLRKLKIIIMSATIDAEKFSQFFNEAPILFVRGRTFAVKVYHLTEPTEEDKTALALKQATYVHLKMPPGDILVFMPGQEEIDGLVKELQKLNNDLPHNVDKIQALPLYRNLTEAKQKEVFSPSKSRHRKIIVSTNIAETGLTLPNIRYVIDGGLQKEKEVLPLTRQDLATRETTTTGTVNALRVRPCSKAAARQRTGRAGRISDGTCYRLYTQEEYEAMPNETTPEIQRSDLSAALLQLMGFGQNPIEFAYMDTPKRTNLIAAIDELCRLRAVTSQGSDFQLEDVGRQLLKFPVSPAMAKALVTSFEEGCPHEIIHLIAIREAGNPVIDIPGKREEGAQARAAFLDKSGDHLTKFKMLKGFLSYLDIVRKQANGQDRTAETKEVDMKEDQAEDDSSDLSIKARMLKWCDEHALSFRVLSEAKKLKEQLEKLSRSIGMDPEVSAGQDSDMVLKCMATGMFMNVARIEPGGKGYKPLRGNLEKESLKIHPSSVLHNRQLPYIMYDEIALTTNYYAHSVSSIDDSWLEGIPGFSDNGDEPFVSSTGATSKSESGTNDDVDMS